MLFVFLFEHTGYAAEPFTKRGHQTIIIDLLNKGPNPRASISLSDNILDKEDEIAELCQNAEFIFGMPPCTDLAVSGARHFVTKYKKNPNFLLEAVHLFRATERIAIKAGNRPYAIENPVNLIPRRWRKPDYYFHPFEFGGYLPPDAEHPEWPFYIRGQDAYPKKSCLWTGNGFRFPRKKPVPCPTGYSLQHLKLGGKSQRTKIIRSASPRGFFEALAQEYCE